jgi:hypothetical protein
MFVNKTSWLLLLVAFFLGEVGLIRIDPAAARSAPAQATIPPSIFILSPREGQALQGVEVIKGKIRGDGLMSGKISFRYSVDGRDTWFFIADIDPQDQDSSQAAFKVEWDTTKITDGNYHLRIVAVYQDGTQIFEQVPNLRIRNYSPVETSTPGPEMTLAPGELAPSATILAPPQPSPTPLPKNPAELEREDLFQTLFLTGAVVLGGFLVGGIYTLIKKRFQ